MSVRHKRMLGILLGAVMTCLWWGCSQPDDIISNIGKSTFYLDPERLPSLPSDMAYELWVTDGGLDTVSLGAFKWNVGTKHFTDMDGNKRPDSNQFNLATDALNYKFILLSVEVNPDPNPENVGPVMLQDTLNDPDLNPIVLRFPLSDSLWNCISFFNMETPTDSNIDANDGYGVWFSSYQVRTDTLRDTFSLDSFQIDTTYTMVPADPSKKGQDTFFVADIINVRDTVLIKILGFDTLEHHVVLYDRVIEHDGDVSTAPGRITTELKLFFTISPTQVVKTYGDFFQIPYGFIDYSSLGWRYNAWVVSTVAADGGCGIGNFTPPAWVTADPIDRYIPGHASAGLLPIGRFTIDTVKDIDNPHNVGPRRPDIPGEDFLTNLPCGSLPADGLIPWTMNSAGTFGSVVVTLEPDNFTKQGQTNFPLVLLSRELPRLRDSVVADTAPQIVEEFLMRNFSGTVHGNPVGFPRVNVTLIRE